MIRGSEEWQLVGALLLSMFVVSRIELGGRLFGHSLDENEQPVTLATLVKGDI